jgi:hypothetical protein
VHGQGRRRLPKPSSCPPFIPLGGLTDHWFVETDFAAAHVRRPRGPSVNPERRTARRPRCRDSEAPLPVRAGLLTTGTVPAGPAMEGRRPRGVPGARERWET